MFGLVLCALLDDRKYIADHLKKVEELAKFEAKECSFTRET